MNDIVLGIVSVTLLILLLVAGIAMAFIIAGRQRIQHEKILAENRLTFEREVRRVETEVSEYTKGQFAQELHDNIGQLLTAMHIQVENQKLDHPLLTDGLKPIEIYISEITQQLRLLSQTLNNDYIGHIGLFGAMQLEIERLKTLRRFTIHWQPVLGTSNLEKDEELMVFRIFQEIIQNALRHSAASNLYLSVKNDQGSFEFNVEDDGQGFDKENVFKQNKASGLRNIVKRAHIAGLECEIISIPGKGTQFMLKKAQHSSWN